MTAHELILGVNIVNDLFDTTFPGGLIRANLEEGDIAVSGGPLTQNKIQISSYFYTTKPEQANIHLGIDIPLPQDDAAHFVRGISEIVEDAITKFVGTDGLSNSNPENMSWKYIENDSIAQWRITFPNTTVIEPMSQRDFHVQLLQRINKL